VTSLPVSGGYSIPEAVPSVSESAGRVRSAAIVAGASSYHLPVSSRAIVDQQELQCCVSCALGAGMEVLHPAWPALAPVFHYYITRYEQGGADEDGFLYLKNALQTLATAGICRGSLHDYPFTSAGAQTRPSSAAYEDALGRALARRGLRNRYIARSSSSTTAWIRDQLRVNCPVVLGIRLPLGYPKTFLNGRFEWLDPDAPGSLSGHCVLVVGYSDVRQAVRIQDSRGQSAFDGGGWWMGYRVVDSPVVLEAYALLP